MWAQADRSNSRLSGNRAPRVFAFGLFLFGVGGHLAGGAELTACRAKGKGTVKPSSLEKVNPAKIPLKERFPGQPRELLSVLGAHRGGHLHSVSCVAFSPDGRWVASGGGDGTVRLWRVKGNRLAEVASVRHEENELEVSFSPDGKVLATSGDESLILWSLSGPRPKLRARLGAWGPATFAPDGKTMITGGNLTEPGIKIWDLRTRKPRERARILADKVTRWELLPGGKTLVLGHRKFTSDGRRLFEVIELWDVSLAKPKKPATLPRPPKGINLDWRNRDKTFRLWDKSGTQPKLRSTFRGHTAELTSVQFLKKGRRVVSSGMDRRVIFWDLAGKKLREWRFPSAVYSVALAPDGRHLATANENGTIYILRIPF